MELLFPSLKEGKNCKIWLVWRITHDPPTVFGRNQACSPAPLYAHFLPNIQYFANHWSMHTFFTSGIDPGILMKVFENFMYILYLGILGFV